MKKHLLAFSLVLMAVIPSFAQREGFKLTWHGFVNPVCWWDTRQVVSGRDGMMLFYPKPVNNDTNGEDLNGVSSLDVQSFTARINLTFQGPDVLGAKVKGFIEGDFTGASEATLNNLRLRHAYLNMRWEHSDMLFGQFWYPMVVQEIMPNTQPLNMGAPFHPYARYGQVRYTHHLNNWELMTTAALQLDNKSQGINGSTNDYQKHSSLPELNAQIRYNGLADDGIFAGLAYNMLIIRPRDSYQDLTNTKTFVTDQLFASHSFSAFARIDAKQWSFRAQTLLSNNLYEGCTMGGYVEHCEWNPAGMPTYSYRPWHFTTLWCDISKTKGAWQPGIFVGYGFNNDLDNAIDPVKDLVYGRGHDIRTLFRIQPHIGYVTPVGLSFWAEAEYTVADYANSGRADNTRLILSALYAF